MSVNKDIQKFDIKKGSQGGFIQVIIVILIALLLMKYFGITVSEVYYWFRSYFADVLR